GSEEPFLFTCDDEEQDGSAEGLCMAPLSQPDKQRNIGGIVERSVVDAVAVHRLTIAIAIEVRGKNDHLIAKRGIRARQEADDVWRRNVALPHGEACPQAAANCEAWQRLPGTAGGDEGGGILATPRNELAERI